MELFVIQEAPADEAVARYAAVRSDGVLVWSHDLIFAKVFLTEDNAKDFADARFHTKALATQITVH